MPTSFGGRSIYNSWGVTLFCPTCAEHLSTCRTERGNAKEKKIVITAVLAYEETQGWVNSLGSKKAWFFFVFLMFLLHALELDDGK